MWHGCTMLFELASVANLKPHAHTGILSVGYSGEHRRAQRHFGEVSSLALEASLRSVKESAHREGTGTSRFMLTKKSNLISKLPSRCKRLHGAISLPLAQLFTVRGPCY